MLHDYRYQELISKVMHAYPYPCRIYMEDIRINTLLKYGIIEFYNNDAGYDNYTLEQFFVLTEDIQNKIDRDSHLKGELLFLNDKFL
ncbi:hypothetical protein [Weissella confusa]|uniref:hypothetical protein n=1 Tax=Weissella confusa TaxID=1583 RepID=UPI001E289F27|nr:hypothetical protein [Weissella confusa]